MAAPAVGRADFEVAHLVTATPLGVCPPF